jgi:hypothetical protein
VSYNADTRAYECDRCGTDLGNANLYHCIVVTRIDDSGAVETLHFCTDRTGDDGKTVKGCDKKVLSSANTQHYTSTHTED